MKLVKILIMGAATLTITACSGGSQPTSEKASSQAQSSHVHTYSNEWSHDDLYHWHNPTCGDTTEPKDKAEHVFGEWVIDTPATETSEGEKHKTCTVCNHSVYETVPAVEKEIAFGQVTLNIDSFEGDYHEYVLVGKTYKVILTIKDSDGNDITASKQIEYKLLVRDGTTNMTGDWARVEETEKAGEFNLTPLSKGTDEHFNLCADYRKKGETTWHSKSPASPSTIAIYTE